MHAWHHVQHPAARKHSANAYRRHVRCSAAVQQPQPQQQQAFSYNSGDENRQKATIEHIFSPDDDRNSSSPDEMPSTSNSASASTSSDTARVAPSAPWAVGWQMNERNTVWSDDLKLRLIKHVACQELGIDEGELEQRLTQLSNLLPALGARLASAPAKLVARLVADPGAVAARLLQLRIIFPTADVASMANNRLDLLLDDDLGEVREAAVKLRELLPTINVDRFAETFPDVLDYEGFAQALQDAQRMLPGRDIAEMLRQTPDLVLSLQKGRHLIPYDQLPNPGVRQP